MAKEKELVVGVLGTPPLASGGACEAEPCHMVLT